MKAPFLAGVATVDITPKHAKHFQLWGMPRLENTRGVLSPLRAEALVLSLEGAPIWVVTCDQLFMDHAVAGRVRGRVGDALSAECGNDGPRILFSVTHCHSAQSEVRGGLNEQAQQWAADDLQHFEDRIVQVCLDAYHARVPAELGSSPVRLAEEVGVCRRMLQTNGTCLDDWNAGAPVLPGESTFGLEASSPMRIDLLALRQKESGALMTVLTSYPSHIHLIPLPLVDPEFAGAAKAELERRLPGTTAMYANGTAGDIQLNKSQSPPPDSSVDAEQAWYQEQMGIMAARFADAVVGELETISFGPPDHLRFLDFCRDSPGDPAAFTGWIEPGIFLQAVSLGSVAFLNVQGELFSAFGRELQDVCPFKTLITLGYHERGYSYIGHELAYEQGSYEIKGTLPRSEKEEILFRENGVDEIPLSRIGAGRETLDRAVAMLQELALRG